MYKSSASCNVHFGTHGAGEIPIITDVAEMEDLSMTSDTQVVKRLAGVSVMQAARTTFVRTRMRANNLRIRILEKRGCMTRKSNIIYNRYLVNDCAPAFKLL